MCTDATGSALLDCEQCLFTYLIDTNTIAPNPLIGSQPALTGQFARLFRFDTCQMLINIASPCAHFPSPAPHSFRRGMSCTASQRDRPRPQDDPPPELGRT